MRCKLGRGRDRRDDVDQDAVGVRRDEVALTEGFITQGFDDLPAMMAACRAILSREALMMTLTAYAIRSSLFAIHEIMMETMTGFDPIGTVTSGELVLQDESAGRKLSSSMYSRWTRA